MLSYVTKSEQLLEEFVAREQRRLFYVVSLSGNSRQSDGIFI